MKIAHSDEMNDALVTLTNRLTSRWMYASELVWPKYPNNCKWLRGAAFIACDPELMEIGNEFDDISTTFLQITSPLIGTF
jgi:hypothetical protein